MTSVIAVPETVSAAKGQPGGMQAVRVRGCVGAWVRVCVCVAVCLRGVPIRVIRRLVVGCALGWTNDCNQQELRAGGARQACLLAPPFPLRKHKWAPPFEQRNPPCLLPSKPLPPTTFSSVRDSASLNLANPRPGIILPSLLPRESRRHINCTRNPLESKHARRGELSCALARPKLSSIEPLFPHVERASVKLCRNTAQRSAATTGVRRPSRRFLISLNLASTPWAMTRSNGDLSHC